MTFRAPAVASGAPHPANSKIPFQGLPMARFASFVVALSLLPLRLFAQEPSSDTTRFHRGQWGVQFGGGSSLFSLGLLRFTSARSAWLLDIASSAQFLSSTSTDKFGGGTSSADQQFVNLNARIGKRFYQAPRRKVVSFQTLAVEGGWRDQMVDISAGNIRQTLWNVGLNGELGGAYMVTPSLSLGGTAIMSAGYFEMKRNNPAAREKGHGYYLNGIEVLFALGLYF